ncbi:MAG: hypothetical protein LBT10_03345 [Methanobrevibacter sp.]|nr:hypothetical protein [Methanobrevibacter sp.]
MSSNQQESPVFRQGEYQSLNLSLKIASYSSTFNLFKSKMQSTLYSDKSLFISCHNCFLVVIMGKM